MDPWTRSSSTSQTPTPTPTRRRRRGVGAPAAVVRVRGVPRGTRAKVSANGGWCLRAQRPRRKDRAATPRGDVSDVFPSRRRALHGSKLPLLRIHTGGMDRERGRGRGRGRGWGRECSRAFGGGGCRGGEGDARGGTPVSVRDSAGASVAGEPRGGKSDGVDGRRHVRAHARRSERGGVGRWWWWWRDPTTRTIESSGR